MKMLNVDVESSYFQFK